MRKVLDQLVAERAAYRIQGRGTFVAEPRIVYADALKGFSEDIRARGMVPGARVLAQEIVTADAVLAGRAGTPARYAGGLVHRVRTADDDPIAVEQAFLPAARFAGLESADLAGGSLFELLEARFGIQMPDAEQRVVAVRITGEDADLLGVEPDDPGFLFAHGRARARGPAGLLRLVAVSRRPLRDPAAPAAPARPRTAVERPAVRWPPRWQEQPDILAALARRRPRLVERVRRVLPGTRCTAPCSSPAARPTTRRSTAAT